MLWVLIIFMAFFRQIYHYFTTLDGTLIMYRPLSVQYWLISREGRARLDLVPQPPLLSALAVVNKNLARLAWQFLCNVPGDGLNIQRSFLRAKLKWIVAVVRLECDPLLGGVQGSVVANYVTKVAQPDKGVGSVGQTLGLVSVCTVSVEKSVTEFKSSELLADDAGKGRSHSSATDVDL